MTAIFWISILLLGYAVVGYPLAVAAWATLRPRPVRRESIEPTVSIVISVHNEASRVEQKITNLLSLDYPADRLEIMVGSDGSTDGTAEQLRAASSEQVRTMILPERHGKPAVLNTLVPETRGDIVVFADVRQQFEPQLLRELVQPFADSRVGAVSGELIIGATANSTAGGNGAGAYWRYEKFIRSRESLVDSTVGATGAIYAIRRELFEPISEDTILDDVLIPLNITRRGYRVLFEPEARAFDRLSSSHEEFIRKARTLAGNFQLFTRERWLLSPFHNRIWLQTVSHKVLRLFFPLLQIAAFLSNAFLVGHGLVYQAVLLGQVLFYSAAIGGFVNRNGRRKLRLLTFPYTFCLMSAASAVGLVRWLRGSQAVTWEKAENRLAPDHEQAALSQPHQGSIS